MANRDSKSGRQLGLRPGATFEDLTDGPKGEGNSRGKVVEWNQRVNLT